MQEVVGQHVTLFAGLTVSGLVYSECYIFSITFMYHRHFVTTVQLIVLRPLRK